MADMLVRLYELPDAAPALGRVGRQGIVVRVARAPEKQAVGDWVRAHFPPWVCETEVTFARLPVSCWIAAKAGSLVGFACYDAICRNFFGPMGVVESERGKGIGKALLLSALHAQKFQGYAYAIVGGIGPAEFYAKAVGATLIERSHPGIYDGLRTG